MSSEASGPALFVKFDFSISNTPAEVMPKPHMHNDIEITILERGWIEYLFGGRYVVIPEGVLCVRWASVPHQSTRFEGGGIHYSMKLPFSWFMGWELPKAFVQALLEGEMLLDRSGLTERSDWEMFGCWFETLSANTMEHQRIVALETEARLRRMALRFAERSEIGTSPQPSFRATQGAYEKMALYIAQHYLNPVRVEDIARAAGLHPNSAMRLFRKSCGMTVLEYLNLHRVWHAQRLLATTELKVRDVALESGFSSPSRFYEVFQKVVGRSPREVTAGRVLSSSQEL